MTPKEYAAYAKRRYPGNTLARVLLYAREATLANLHNPAARPKSIVLNIQGHAGTGKTAIVEFVARNEDLEYVSLDVGGITDVADVFGIPRVNPETGYTEVSKPSWWPRPGTYGIINVDDATRALPHVLQAIQQFVIERRFNNLVVPDGWTIVMTTNPDDGEYNVSSTDNAFETRVVTLTYNRDKEIFLEQLERQGVHDLMVNFWRQNDEQLNMPILKAKQPKSNDRHKMIWNHLFPYLIEDDDALTLVGSSMFGFEWVTSFRAFLQSDQPIPPEEILEDYRRSGTIRSQVEIYFKQGRNDLLKVTCHRLLLRMRNQPVVSTDGWANIAAFMLDLPNDVGGWLFLELVKPGKPYADLFGSMLQVHTELYDRYGEIFQKVE